MGGDTSWFPKPPPKPIEKPPSMTRLLAATLLPVIAIAGVVVALSTSHSHAPSKTSSTPTAANRQRAANAAADQRAAFDSCMKSMGAGGGGGRGGFGFGGGINRSAMRNQLNKLREAQAACNAILSGGPAPGPAPTQTGSAPAA